MERGVDTWWDHLVDVLATLGEVTDRDPGGLTVVLDGEGGSTRAVEIVMTPDEWDDMCGIGGWEMDAGAQHVRQQVKDLPRDKRYLVYGLYNLVPCDSPSLPVDPAFARLQELALNTRTAFRVGAGTRTSRTRPRRRRRPDLPR